MSQYLETFDEHQSLARYWLRSGLFHLGVAGLIVLLSAVNVHRGTNWGSQNPGGGAIGINVVHSIPLPARAGTVNPLASDSQTTVPLPPPKAKPTPRVKEPEPDAIPLKSSKAQKKASEPASRKTTYRAPGQDKPNQLYSESGPALVTQLIGTMGNGGIGVGTGSTLGDRFGWYIDLLKTKVAEHWRPDAQASQPTVVTFDLMKDGSVKDVRIGQRSGNTLLDFAAQRAILDAAPFQPMPNGAGNSAHIEFWFNVRR